MMRLNIMMTWKVVKTCHMQMIWQYRQMLPITMILLVYKVMVNFLITVIQDHTIANWAKGCTEQLFPEKFHANHEKRVTEKQYTSSLVSQP